MSARFPAARVTPRITLLFYSLYSDVIAGRAGRVQYLGPGCDTETLALLTKPCHPLVYASSYMQARMCRLVYVGSYMQARIYRLVHADSYMQAGILDPTAQGLVNLSHSVFQEMRSWSCFESVRVTTY